MAKIRLTKQHKYHAKPCEVNGQKYRSQKEMRRHNELLLMEKNGLIKDLRREIPFVLAPSLVVNGRLRPAMRYYADFVYWDNVANKEIINDCKGFRTPVYKLKRHLMACKGWEILET